MAKKQGKKKADLLQGTLDMLILKSLVAGPKHGYGVAGWIKSTTSGALQIEEGSLYPALHRMQKHGWLDSEWGVSESNRKAKFYSLTKSGRSQLKQEVRAWEHLVQAIGLVINSKMTEAGK